MMDILASVWGSMSLDVAVLGGAVLLFAFDAFQKTTARVISLTFAFPLALFLFTFLQDASFISAVIGQFSTPAFEAFPILALVVGLYLCVRRIVDTGPAEGPPQALLVATAGVVIILVTWLSSPALSSLLPLNGLQTLFAEAYRFWWLAGAFLLLAATRR